jgi:hypothetical protein
VVDGGCLATVSPPRSVLLLDWADTGLESRTRMERRGSHHLVCLLRVDRVRWEGLLQLRTEKVTHVEPQLDSGSKSDH